MFKIISFAKEERIDKQYYVTSRDNVLLTKESAEDMLKKAEEFIVQIKLFIKDLNIIKIEEVRKAFVEL